eukprot:1654887-Lingulodinium_polyedra.AAC.1
MTRAQGQLRQNPEAMTTDDASSSCVPTGCTFLGFDDMVQLTQVSRKHEQLINQLLDKLLSEWA